MNDEYIEKTIPIGSVAALLEQGYDLEVDSPDGWVGISEFVDKGMWDEYVFECNGKKVHCNENHLFETTVGWMSAKNILHHQDQYLQNINFLCNDGKFHEGEIRKTLRQIPIVDIQVESEKHRYYTNGISSHNTGVGKTIGLCHLAANYLSQGLNVLYITLEMSEERIAERIDANLLDIDIGDLNSVSSDEYFKAINKIKSKTQGKLIIKEYPTAAAHTGHFRALMNELKLKKNFVPDIILIDYLNICASSRIKALGGSINTYSYVKAIAEEVRGLAVEFDVPIWSATQVNRTGFNSSDVELTDTSESFGLPATSDLFLALITSEQLEALNQIMIKQLKNRYNDMNFHRRFVIGVDKPKMRWYDVEETAQNDILPEISEYQIGTNENKEMFNTDDWNID